MESINEKAAEGATSTAQKQITKTTDNKNIRKFRKIKEGTKERKVLEALVSGRSFNRFEAARELHDWCLHSTVSTLQGKGIEIHRQSERVPCLDGNKTTDVMRYSLLPNQFEKARELLGIQV